MFRVVLGSSTSLIFNAGGLLMIKKLFLSQKCQVFTDNSLKWREEKSHCEKRPTNSWKILRDPDVLLIYLTTTWQHQQVLTFCDIILSGICSNFLMSFNWFEGFLKFTFYLCCFVESEHPEYDETTNIKHISLEIRQISNIRYEMVSANTASWFPKTSEFYSGHRVVKKILNT